VIAPQRLARLLVWARRIHPDHPEWGQHQYIGDCPWCRGDEPALLEGGAHGTALELLQELATLEAWLASAETVLLDALEGPPRRPNWRDEAVALLAGLNERSVQAT
jgi:hypothetical protein